MKTRPTAHAARSSLGNCAAGWCTWTTRGLNCCSRPAHCTATGPSTHIQPCRPAGMLIGWTLDAWAPSRTRNAYAPTARAPCSSGRTNAPSPGTNRPTFYQRGDGPPTHKRPQTRERQGAWSVDAGRSQRGVQSDVRRDGDGRPQDQQRRAARVRLGRGQHRNSPWERLEPFRSESSRFQPY